ncbi:MAG: energy transducer TonB [Gammaproteobacteria bacterium]|nr:energy transducer TonB [Gammaproteobacteria bacterium]
MLLHAADLAVPGVPVEESSLRRLVRLAVVLGLHGLFLLALWQLQQRPVPEPEPIRMAVRVIERSLPVPEVPRQAPAVPETPMPPPPVQLPKPRPVVVPEPAARPAPRIAAPVAPAPPPPESMPTRAPAAPAPAPVLTAVRFDAAYLNNPAPVYPRASRRRGEQGRVLLQVQVNARGLPEQVEIHEGSGYARLDTAAREAVQRWRFVPARRGGEAIAASVLVPILFQME